MEHLVSTHSHLVAQFKHQLLKEREPIYTDAEHLQGALPNKLVIFINNTKVRMFLPSGNRLYHCAIYSGHKRMHCLICHIFTIPYGLIFSLFGPEVGIIHDLTLLNGVGVHLAVIGDTGSSCTRIDGSRGGGIGT